MDSIIWIYVGGVFVLLLFSAFFSGSETALTAISKAKLHQLEKEGNERAALVNKLRLRKEKLIGGILLGNNLVNILASALTTSLFISLIGEAGVAVATLVMTILVLIFAEVLPKTYAIHHADKMALKVAPILSVVIMILAPVTNAVTWVVGKVLLMCGIDMKNKTVHFSDKELRGAIELHQGQREEIRHERAMLRSILDLDQVDVSEIMTHRRNIDTIDSSLDADEIIDQISKSPHTRLPLWQDDPDNIIGVLNAKDVFRELHRVKGKRERLNFKKMSTPPWFIPDTTDLFVQLQAFRNRREHFALVVDEYGSLMGLVTLEDILEEIVGDIDDEHDVAPPGIQPQGDETTLVDGRVTIRDLNRHFEWDLPDDEASTIAGLILHEAERIPEPGQIFTFYGMRFEIVRKQRNQITLVRLYTQKKPAAKKKQSH